MQVNTNTNIINLEQYDSDITELKINSKSLEGIWI